MKKKLTIVIPTYNRKDRLLRQIKAIVSQDEFPMIHLRVVDNHSPYDVESIIRNNFSEEICNNMEIIVRPYNLGLALAISLPFIECKTDWLWILSDDDLVVGNLSVVLNDLCRYNGYALLKYNIINSRPQEERDIAHINDFISYYTDLHPTGDLVFISNAIFNIKVLSDYRHLAVVYEATVVGHLIPILKALCDGKAQCHFRNYNLIKYQKAPVGTGYDPIWVTLGLAHIGDIDFSGDLEINRRITEMLQYDVKYIHMMNTLMTNPNRSYRSKHSI